MYSVCASSYILSYCLISMLYVRRPTSSPCAIWNSCKINKALNSITSKVISYRVIDVGGAGCQVCMSSLYLTLFSIFDPDMIVHVLAYLTCTLHWVSNSSIY